MVTTHAKASRVPVTVWKRSVGRLLLRHVNVGFRLYFRRFSSDSFYYGDPIPDWIAGN
jgi:hypothetical protein